MNNNEEEEYQELVKQLEEINIEELLMNIESSRASNRNNQGQATQGTSSNTPITLTSTERTSRTTQPLQTPASYEFTSYPE